MTTCEMHPAGRRCGGAESAGEWLGGEAGAALIWGFRAEWDGKSRHWPTLQLESCESANSEADPEYKQHSPREALGPTLDCFADTTSDREANLCDHECLSTDQHDGQ